MRQKGIVFSTSLSIKECADLFREAAEDVRGPGRKLLESAANLMGNGEMVGYYTPPFDSPFAAVDGRPDLAVGIHVLKFFGGGQGRGTSVHMYVDERQDHREVQLVSKHGLTEGMRSARLTGNFFERFQAADTTLEVTGRNI